MAQSSVSGKGEGAKAKAKVVDIHTHMYPPEYIKILESRSTIPLVRRFPGSPDPRLVLLEAEVPLLEAAEKERESTATDEPPAAIILPGRPLTRHFSSLPQKLHFMDTHGVDVSVLSLANPWLDFVDPQESPRLADTVNRDFDAMCARHPGRLFFFAALPLTAATTAEVIEAVKTARALKYCRGVVMGTAGIPLHSQDGGKPGGSGLDDPSLLPVFQALAAAELPVFLHPHYGLPNEVFGPRAGGGEYGHVLPLALGFPVETTVAVARMYLAGVFDAVPGLRLILAHSGGALPFLAGRIEACVRHDAYLVNKSQSQGQRRRTVWDVLREQVYLDAVIYADVGLRAAIAAAGGADRLMFGTDHPFFPPVGEGADEEGEWESVRLNAEAVKEALGEGTAEAEGVLGGNAVRVLRL